MLLFFGQIRPGVDPGQGKNRSPGGPLLQRTSSSDLKATATNQIPVHSNDLEACGMKCCYFLFHSEVKFLTRFWRLFGLSHFALFWCNFYRFLCGKVFNLHLFCVISVFISGNNASIKDLNALRILMNFWCIYLGKERGGCAVMHVYVWEHIVSLYYRTTWWMFTKLDRDEVLMTLHMH